MWSDEQAAQLIIKGDAERPAWGLWRAGRTDRE
jgi:hypothetical protein